MKKFFIIIAIIGLGMTNLFSQEIKETTVELKKQMVNAYSVSINQTDANTAMEAFKSFFASQNFVKPKKEGNYTYYIAQKFPVLGSGNYDLYFTATQNGKKNNITTTVFFVCSMGNENYVNSKENAEIAANINTFLSKTPLIIERYNMEQEIAKNEKEAQKLIKDKEKTQKSLDKIQKAMEQHNSKIDKINKSISNTKDKLNKFVIFE